MSPSSPARAAGPRPGPEKAPQATAWRSIDVLRVAGIMVPIKLLYVQGVVGDEVPILGEEERD